MERACCHGNIATARRFLKRMLRLPEEDRIIFVDTEFGNKGDGNVLSLVQIRAIMDEEATILDVYQCPAILKLQKLKELMESENIKKVFHGCREDVKLLKKCNIDITNFDDVQLMHSAVHSVRQTNLREICERNEVPRPKEFESSCNIWEYVFERINGQLPLALKSYAASDVNCLPALYQTLQQHITHNDAARTDYEKSIQRFRVQLR